MIETIKDIDSLIEKIGVDKSTRHITQKRFPVRYIFLSNFYTLQKLVDYVIKIDINIFDISQLLPKEDGWITKQEFISKIKLLDTEKDFLLLPFSEIARFYESRDFNNLFSQLNELENIGNSNQRFYVPLTGIKDRFRKEFYENFNRKNEYSFVWSVEGNINRKIVFMYSDTSININRIKTIKGTKEWLNFWKKDSDTPILCLSRTLFSLVDNAKPDEIFDFRKINNPNEFIENVYNIDIPIKYSDEEKEFWKELINKLNERNFVSFSEIVEYLINVKKINKENFIQLWLAPERSNFEKWLIKNYIIYNCKYDDSYLYITLSNLNSFDNLDILIGLWNNIFNIDNASDEIFADRKFFLRQFYNIDKIELPADFLNGYIDKLKSKNEKTQLKIITGLLDFEKELILEKYIKNGNEDILLNYPDLKNYIEDSEYDDISEEQEWVYSYFNEYKVSKLKDEYTEEIKSRIDELNKNEESFYKWYFSFNEISKFINKEKFDYIFWIDALGVEWMSLVEFLLSKKKYNIENKYIARVDLPSTTEVNRYNYEDLKYVQDFDKFIHNNIYSYPKTIVNEIEKIKEIIEKLVIQKGKRAIIISDHGLSALVRLNESNKNFKQAEHEGRYIHSGTVSSFQSDENYILKDNYVIS